MGLTKQYLRYVPAGNTNIIASPHCNIVFVTLEDQEGRFIAAAACEHVYIWDLRLGEKVKKENEELNIEVIIISLCFNIYYIMISGASVIWRKDMCNTSSCIAQ